MLLQAPRHSKINIGDLHSLHGCENIRKSDKPNEEDVPDLIFVTYATHDVNVKVQYDKNKRMACKLSGAAF